MTVPRLGRRLATAAALVRPGRRVADVGTDHAYLPVWLVAHGVTPFAVATDLREGPAARAARTVAAAGLEGRVAVRVGDGLSSVAPDEAEDIVIAGMGGETAAAILEAASWVRREDIRLILQPMSKPEFLREYLLSSGFVLREERQAADGRHLYTVMAAEFDPAAAARQAEDPSVFLRGALDAAEGALYFDRLLARLHKEEEALCRAGRREEAAACRASAASLAAWRDKAGKNVPHADG